MNIILLGCPGSGKGTQAEALTRHLGIPVVSTGNMLREAIAQSLPIGLEAKSYMDAGRLVPDRVMVDIVELRLRDADCIGGFILDGFPRTLGQAEALDAIGVRVDVVLSLEVPDEDIERRMCGRLTCRQCGYAYHRTSLPPAVENICDACGGALFRREDDNPETVRARLAVYHENTEPLKGYYQTLGKLRSVPARGDIGEITERLLAELKLQIS